MKTKLMVLVMVFCAGYIVNDVAEFAGHSFVTQANADDPRSRYYIESIVEDVALDEYDVRRIAEDVAEDVVEDCSFDGGYVQNGYVYGVSASC
tara:strand:+ start:465 stop:743 length:279 start_codon:yes stop_codon:yes gene_type:complete